MKKKIVLCISICCLLILSPIALGVSLPNTTPLQKIVSSPQSTTLNDEPPAWAKGNFSGVWGVTVLGVPFPPAGWITGYYQIVGLGNLDAVYATFNDTNATSFLRGIMLWIFFLGGAGNLTTNKGTWVTGIGVANDTAFYWRLNAIIGPSFYILCNYTTFGNTTTTKSTLFRLSHKLTNNFPTFFARNNILKST